MAGGILNYAENYPLQVFKMYGGILSKVRSNLKKMIGVVFHKFGEKTIIKQRREIHSEFPVKIRPLLWGTYAVPGRYEDS